MHSILNSGLLDHALYQKNGTFDSYSDHYISIPAHTYPWAETSRALANPHDLKSTRKSGMT